MAQQGQRRTRCALAAGLVLLGSCALQAVVTSPAGAAGADLGRQLVSRGTTTPTSGSTTTRHGGLFTGPEVAGAAAGAGSGPNRSQSVHGGRHTAGSTALTVDGTKPGLGRSFQGLGITDDASAAGFVLEPPDQGLCVGSGSVLELVNVVGKVYSMTGESKSQTFYLNDLFHETSADANASDPSCYYDPGTKRFYADMLFYDSDPKTGQLNGHSRIDLAVSDSSDPNRTWKAYSFDVTADGSSNLNLGDYPIIGADAEGVYITTNSYPIFANGFGGAQLYALSKKGLATGTDTRVTRVPLAQGQGATAFGLRPTTAPAAAYAHESGGTEYLLSSQATAEAGNKQGFDQGIGLWALTGTDTLAPGGSRALRMDRTSVTVDRYGVPPLSDQKAGPYPLGQCLSDAACKKTVFGSISPVSPHVEGQLDSSDSRMNQTIYSKGLVLGTLDTVVNVGGEDRAGLAYYVLRPTRSNGGVLQSTVVSQGQVGVAGNNLIYGAFGVTGAGKAVLATNVVGRDHYPSAGYLTFDASWRPSAVHVSGVGAAPTDGFTEYTDFTGDLRPRWGDYAATAFDPDTGSVWTANEYVASSCTVTTYQADPTCGGSRSPYGNWSTRVSQILP